MPRTAKELTPIEVKRLTKPGMHAVGGVVGLLLQISPNRKSRHWIYRTTINGKRRHTELGSFPTVTLAMARQLARENYLIVRGGQNPIEERTARISARVAAEKRAMTFADAMEKYLEIKLSEFDNEKKPCKQWRATLDKYAIPELGKVLVADIQIRDVLRTLEPIWAKKLKWRAACVVKLNQLSLGQPLQDIAKVKILRVGKVTFQRYCPNPQR